MGLAGILLGLALLVVFAFRGWSVLLLAPAAAVLAAAFAGEPLLAHWTQTFMASAAQFLAQFFPLFLMGALFGKLMEDSGSVTAIAQWMTERLGAMRAMLAVVLAGALVTYGGVSLFVAFFVLAPMAEALFRTAALPRRLMPAALALGTSTFTMSALPGTPAIQNAIPMPFFGTTPFAAPGLGVIAAAIMLVFGLWWLERASASARRRGEGFGGDAPAPVDAAAEDPLVRERATTAQAFDPAEIHRSQATDAPPPILLAALPLVVVIGVNLLMSFVVLPRMDTDNVRELLRPYGGSLEAFLVDNFPNNPGKRFYYQPGWSGAGTVNGLAFALLAWPWLTFVTLLLFRFSMRRARIRPVHVLRCVLYSFDAVLWAGMVAAALVAATVLQFRTTPPRGMRSMVPGWLDMLIDPYMQDPVAKTLLAAAALLLPFMAWRLTIAYRQYLRFDRPAATVLASQVIVLLVFLVLAVNGRLGV